MKDEKEPDNTRPTKEPELVQQIFGDFEARNNIVSLFDLLLRIDKRINPQDYKTKATQ